MAINKLTPVNKWPTHKLPQERFDDTVKASMDQMSTMVGELNENFIPETNEAIEVINKISPNIDAILDAPNQAAAAAASAQAAASSKTAAAQSATEAADSKNAAASSASSASASKTAASQSATEAASSASSASSSKTAAAQSASDAAEEADNAAQSASAAASSASAAASSKTAAAQSATEAAASAQAAASSKTAAAQSAATAKDEADRAKDEADRAVAAGDVDIASPTKAGLMKPDNKTLKVTDTSGTATVVDVAINGVLTDTARGRGQIGDCYSIPSSGVDFNTLTKSGRYWFSSAAFVNSTNKPPTNIRGFCDVLGAEVSQEYAKQIYHVYKSPIILIREQKGTTQGWSETWTKLIAETDLATTSSVGVSKIDGITVNIDSDGTLSVPIFEGSFAGLVPDATSADAKKALLGDGTWGAMEDDTTSMTISKDLILTADSPRAIVLTAEVSGLAVRLPDHTILTKGTTFRLWVRPLEDIQLCDYSGQPIRAYPSLAPGTAMLVQLVDASAGLWALAEYKSGSTSDAEGAPGLTVGDLLIFSSSSISNVTVVKLTETKALVCYSRDTNICACVLTISGTTVTAGTVQSIFLGGSLNSLSVTALSESTAVLGYGMLGDSYLIKARILSISGTSIVFGDELILATNSASIRSIFIDAVSNTSAVALYDKAQRSRVACVLTVSGTTITAGDSVSLAYSITGVTALSETKAIALFTSGKACVLTISGTTVSAGAEQAFTSGAVSAVSATAISATKAIVCYSGGKACVLNISGTTVSPGTEKAIGSGDNASVAALSEVKALVCYSDSGNSSYGTARFLSISGTTITAADEPFIFNSGTTSDVSVAAIKGNAAVVAFNSNSNAGVSGVIAIN